MKKTKSLFGIAATTGLVAFAMALSISFDSRADLADGEGSPTGPSGCYTSTVLACPGVPPIYNGGQAKLCDFTGVWGAPIECTESQCGKAETTRRCVKG